MFRGREVPPIRVLVTGGSGFVGRALVECLIAHGHDVVCAVRSNGADTQASTSSVSVGDIDAHTDWHSALQGVDVVAHLAGRAHVLRESSSNPLQAFREVNVGGTLSLARQAAAAGVRRMVFVSSIGVHGVQSRQPFTEADIPAPIEPYAISKWEAEKGLVELLNSSRTEFVIIRPPLVYGPNAPGNFGRLSGAVKKGALLPLGAVNNRRTLVALGNLVDLIHLCATHPSAANEVFLAGDAEDLSTTELLRRLGRALGRPARLLPVPVWSMEAAAGLAGRRATIQKLCGDLQVDISKARQMLGWNPPLSVDEGLRHVAEGMR